jgi:hypothetical protein
MRTLWVAILLCSACSRAPVAMGGGGKGGGKGSNSDGGGAGSDGSIAISDGGAAPDGAPPDCPSMPMPYQPCSQNGFSCTSHCNGCGVNMYTTDPIVWQCLPDPSAGSQLKWTTFDEVDCYPLKGYCPGVYSDSQCRVPLDC